MAVETAPCHRFTRLPAIVVLAASITVQVAGKSAYEPPPPKCPMFKCSKKQKPVGKVADKLWTYGCKESGINFMSMGGFDPNNPLGGMNSGPNVDKCCVERDICKQTCGMSAEECHKLFWKCAAKKCKGDQNCDMAAMMADVMSEPYEDKENDNLGDTKDFAAREEDRKCRSYKRWQEEACQCVAEDKFEASVATKLKAFYKKYNPEKLGKDGEIKDAAEVNKKWKNKEPEMFLALATKYKDKAVERRVKPKPPPYKPPPAKTDAEAATSDEPEEAEVEEPPPAPQEPEVPEDDADDLAFDSKAAELTAEKKQAAAAEDYDAADEAKEKLIELRSMEVKRLNAKKAQAIDEENYQEAKRLKMRLAKVEL